MTVRATPGWAGSVRAITLVVDDVDRSREFYERALGTTAVHTDDDSAVVAVGGLLVNLLDARAAVELLAPTPVGGPGGPRFVLTVEVADVDEVCAVLTARGVTLVSGPVDRPWGPRTASFADPDGHVWEIAR